MITWMEVAPSPIALRDLLQAHRMLPDLLLDPISLIRFANMTQVGFTGTAENPGIVILESPWESTSRLVHVIVKDKLLSEHEDLLPFADLLHKRWFEDMKLHRVEARVEVERGQTLKFLKALGFHQETAPSGLRKAMFMHGELVNIHVLGLLESDKPRLRLKRVKSKDKIEEREGSHA